MTLLDGPTFQSLSKELLSRLPEVTADARQVGLALYRLLAEGVPVTPDRLAENVGRSREDVATVLEQLRNLVYTEGDDVIGFGGLAVRPMTHRLLLDGKQLYTWCAWDSLFITNILGESTVVESSCPEAKVPIRLEVSPSGVTRVEPAETVMSILLPDAEDFEEDAERTMRGFCHFVHFFASPTAAEAWATRHAGTAVLSLDEAFTLGVRMNESRWR